jgi:hypothetical protein
LKGTLVAYASGFITLKNFPTAERRILVIIIGKGFRKINRKKRGSFFGGIDIIQYKIELFDNWKLGPFIFLNIFNINLKLIIYFVGKIAETITIIIGFTFYDALPHKEPTVNFSFYNHFGGVFFLFPGGYSNQ